MIPRQPRASSRRARLLAVGLSTASAIAIAACGSSSDGPVAAPTATSGSKLVVATTVAPITSIVSQVAGDLATVQGIVPEGTNSHTFEPPPSAAKLLAQSDIVFINGLKLEDPTRELAVGNRKPGAETVELGTLTLPESDYIYDFSFPKEEGKPNPHLWTNPPMAKRYAEIARDTLARRDPANADAYKRNAAAYIVKLDDLDARVATASKTMTPKQRQLLTYHDAYAYFAEQYDWTVVGAIQPSDFEQPTPKEIADLITQVKSIGVPAIFGSEVFPSPVLEQIGKEAGVRYVDVLRDDDLPGAPGQPDHSFLGLMKFDYVTMVKSLGGDASALEAFDASDVIPDKATYPQ